MIHERIQGRGPRPDSENLGWRTEGFRGYADFMELAEFQGNFEELIGLAKDTLVVIMCAEAAYLRCHRQLIADACWPGAFGSNTLSARLAAFPIS
jgi:uncharacterized protein (DUF488 family)